MAELAPGPGREAEPGPLAVSAEAVLRELGLFELRCCGEAETERLVELCVAHGLDPVALANELLAFITSRDLDPQLSASTLDSFEHELLSRRSSRRPPPRRDPHPRGGLHDVHSLQELLEEEEEEELLDSYATPSKGPHKRPNSTPETPHPKRPLSSRSPSALFSPSSFSPRATPPQKYPARGGRGQVVASFGSGQGLSWGPREGGGRGPAPTLFGDPEEQLRRPYKFMFQQPLAVRQVLSWRMEELGAALRSHHGLEDFGSLALPAQEPVTVLGQIGCDGNGKLNARSVLLEGDPEHSAGEQLPLDLSELQDYSLFPGQVVALEGTNSSGRRLLVSRIFEGVPLPFHQPTEPLPPGQTMVLLACGPYTTSDSVAYDPLSDLLGVIGHLRPDVCILFGPFLDVRHQQVQSCQLLASFADLFQLCLRTIIEGTRSAGSHLVFVPSLRDAHHDCVYPQPPFLHPDLPREDKARVHFVSDPCTLDIAGVIFGLTSTDLLFHMGAEEISGCSGASDRFTRILKHILTQRSYYPLYPPAEELNVDYTRFDAFASLPVTPDVLVTPSELQYFVKEVLGCVCINPGRLTKGQVGGTYGRLYLQREPPAGERRSPCVAAQVVKI